MRRHPFATSVVVVVLLAAGLRGRNFGRGGLVHFDEGAYACGGLVLASMPPGEAIGKGGLSPIIAPPVMFLSVGAAFRLVGVADWVASLVPLLAGISTVALTAVLARMWLQETVSAVAAAAFLATMEYHLIYSRLVLSDGVFLLTLVAALLLFTRAHAKECWAMYVLAGAMTGVC